MKHMSVRSCITGEKHSFNFSFICSSINSFIYSIVCSFILSFIHSFIPSFSPSFIRSSIFSFNIILILSFFLSFVSSIFSAITPWSLCLYDHVQPEKPLRKLLLSIIFFHFSFCSSFSPSFFIL